MLQNRFSYGNTNERNPPALLRCNTAPAGMTMAAASPLHNTTKCQYKTGKCQSPRAFKRNGALHSLCEEHRMKQNMIQRRSDRKYQSVHAEKRRQRSLSKASMKKQVSMAMAQQAFYQEQAAAAHHHHHQYLHLPSPTHAVPMQLPHFNQLLAPAAKPITTSSSPFKVPEDNLLTSPSTIHGFWENDHHHEEVLAQDFRALEHKGISSNTQESDKVLDGLALDDLEIEHHATDHHDFFNFSHTDDDDDSVAAGITTEGHVDDLYNILLS